MLAARVPIGIIDLEAALLGAVTTMSLLVLLPDDGALVENVDHGVGQNNASYEDDFMILYFRK